MNERYVKLFSLPIDLLAKGAPVAVTGGNLLKDNQSGRLLAQLRFQNMGDSPVKAVQVALTCVDPNGAELQGAADFLYRDLAAQPGETFGQRTAIPVPDATRSFAVRVKQVVLEDGTVWSGEDDAPAAPEGVRLAQEQADREAAAKAEARERAAARRAAEQEEAQEERTDRGTAGRGIKIALAILIPTIVVCVAAVFLVLKVLIPNRNYNKAVALYEAGEYEEAIDAFEALNGYMDSDAKIKACKTGIKEKKYDAAMALYEAGKYEEAIDAFEALDGFKDSDDQIKACRVGLQEQAYQAAVDLYNAKQYEEAANAFAALEGYKDSETYRKNCRAAILRKAGHVIDGYIHTVAVKEDGTVLAVGWNDNGQCNVSSWRDIVSVAAGWRFTVGLKADGTVVATKFTGDQKNNFGQCDVDTWRDIVAIDTGESRISWPSPPVRITPSVSNPTARWWPAPIRRPNPITSTTVNATWTAGATSWPSAPVRGTRWP